jgi:predicted acylesterase/phospholipase RssA
MGVSLARQSRLLQLFLRGGSLGDAGMSSEHLSRFVNLSEPGSDGYPTDLPRFGAPVAAAEPDPAIYPTRDGGTVALPCFEIGLVLAGAVSAGAYTAGVLDYLWEVLDDWEAAKEADAWDHGADFGKWRVPPHALRIRVVAGASAGSVCTALIAVAAQRRFLPVRATESNLAGPDALRDDNPFYDLWVNRLDIRGMLETGDVPPDSTFMDLRSLLNSGVVRAAADSVLAARQGPVDGRAFPKLRRYVADPLPVALSIANLNGVPFRYRFEGLEGARFATIRHADVKRFLVHAVTAPDPHATRPGGFDVVEGLPTSDSGLNPKAAGWVALADAALASGAFPVAFAPIELRKSADDYRFDLRLRGDTEVSDAGLWAQPATLCAGFSTVDGTIDHRFDTADGGTMNNQPFQYARGILTGPLGELDGKGETARKAMVIIDPFPADEKEEPAGLETPPRAPLNVVAAAAKLLRAWINQARYDANDLALAADAELYSRFMLSPLRARLKADGSKGGTALGQAAIASGAMGGFSGFLSIGYRHHDFLLGRRNAENFLRNYFALPMDNGLFNKEWWDAQPDEVKAQNLTLTAEPGTAKEGERLIVPSLRASGIRPMRLADSRRAHAEEDRRKSFVREALVETSPTWPGAVDNRFNPDSLVHLIEGRAEALADVALRSLAPKLPRFVRAIVRRAIGNKLGAPSANGLRNALEKHGHFDPMG